MGPMERVIKPRKATQDSVEQRHASKSPLKMLKTQLTHNLAIKTANVQCRDYLHYRLINQSHREISICITKCTMSARSNSGV